MDMSNTAYSTSGVTRQRYLLVEYLTDILVFLSFLLVTIRVPGVSKFTAMGWLGVMLLLLIVRRNEAALVVVRWWPLLIAPLLACFSFFWSEAPGVSGRYGMQLLFTAFVGVVMARTLSPSRLLSMLFLAMFVFCLMSLATGRQGISAEGPVLIGLVGSKNQMAFMSFLLAITAYATLLNGSAHRMMRLLSLPGMALGAFLIATTASATALLMSVGCMSLFTAFIVLQGLKPAGRIGVVVALALLASPIILLLPEINRGVEDFIINVLHKDPGLTGRDYLWARADELIARKPVLGYGYQALWLGESADTLGLLRWAGVVDGRTFSFHNTFRQFAVDTGLVGVGLLLLTVAAGLLAAVKRYVMAPTLPTSLFFTLLIAIFAQMQTESLLGAFTTQTVLIYSCLAVAFWRPIPGWTDVEQPVAASAPPSYPLAVVANRGAGYRPHYLLERHALRAPAAPNPDPQGQQT